MRKLASAASCVTMLLAILLSLGLPVSASADTRLLGYQATAQAVAVRVEVFDPTLGIPASPQGDVGIGYTRSVTQSGPSSRALASYLWPGDVLGDGLGLLLDPALDYPVKVNSKYPATDDAPEHNTAQLSNGNGMTTSASKTMTGSTVTGAGITGADSVAGPGQGVCELLKQSCPAAPGPPAPVVVPDALAVAATMTNVESQSTVTLAAKTITAVAHTHASDLNVLGGLITIGDVDMTSTAVSDGKKGTSSAVSKISGLEIAGQKVELGSSVTIGDQSTSVPEVPQVLASMGVEVDYLQSQRTVNANAGSLAAQGLVITVDTRPLYKALSVGTAVDTLSPIIGQIPTIGENLQPLLTLAPKIVIVIGDVTSSATASPEYTYAPIDGGVLPWSDLGDGGIANDRGTGFGNLLTPASLDDGSLSGVGDPSIAPDSTTSSAQQLSSLVGPALSRLPLLQLLGGLFVAGGLAWLLRSPLGGLLLGAERDCSLGLERGLPNLRRG